MSVESRPWLDYVNCLRTPRLCTLYCSTTTFRLRSTHICPRCVDELICSHLLLSPFLNFAFPLRILRHVSSLRFYGEPNYYRSVLRRHYNFTVHHRGPRSSRYLEPHFEVGVRDGQCRLRCNNVQRVWGGFPANCPRKGQCVLHHHKHRSSSVGDIAVTTGEDACPWNAEVSEEGSASRRALPYCQECQNEWISVFEW